MTTEHQLVIREIFHSIQGESSWAGCPCVFVRLTGCPLGCRWCDTDHARREGTPRNLEAILEEVDTYRCRLVEVTGGEPLAQPAVHDLMRRLADRGFTVLLETSGALPIDGVDRRVHRIVDVKCPDSGECHSNLVSNWSHLTSQDELKFVLAGREDYEWARRTIAENGFVGRVPVLMSPVCGRLEPALLAEWILEDRLEVRFQVQLHRIVWPGVDRGV